MNIRNVEANGSTYDLEDNKSRGMIANAYNAEKTYSVNDLCIYGDTLRQALESTTGDFDATKWKTVTIEEIKNGLDNRVGNPDAYNENNIYSSGDFCIYNNHLYRCNVDMDSETELPHSWTASEWTATTILDLYTELNENLGNKGTLKIIDLPSGTTITDYVDAMDNSTITTVWATESTPYAYCIYDVRKRTDNNAYIVAYKTDQTISVNRKSGGKWIGWK